MLEAIGVLEEGDVGGLMLPPLPLPPPVLRLLRVVADRAVVLRRLARGVLVAAGSTSGVTAWMAAGAAGWAGLTLAAAGGWEAPAGDAPAAAAVAGPEDAAEGLEGVAMAGGWKRGSWNVQSANRTFN